jgi:hypothetical protein
MISPKRMVEIFRRRGGGEFANLTEKLTPGQIAYLEKMAGGEPLIALLSSESEWFALTKSHFVVYVPENYAVCRSITFIKSRYPGGTAKMSESLNISRLGGAT